MSSKSSFEMDGNIHTIRVEEFDDGSMRIYEYFNGELVSSAVMYEPQSGIMHITTYEYTRGQREASVETINVIEELGAYIAIDEYMPQDSTYIGIAPLSWRHLGTVIYECWSHGDRGFHSFNARVSYLNRVPTRTEFTIRSLTATTVRVLGLVVAVLGVPGAVAGTVAAWVVWIAGVTTHVAGTFFISLMNLSSDRTVVDFIFSPPAMMNINTVFTHLVRYVIESTTFPQHTGRTFWVEQHSGFGPVETVSLFGNAALTSFIYSTTFGLYHMNTCRNRAWSSRWQR